MHITTPSVYLISKPTLDWDAVESYLDEVGGREWFDRAESGDQSDAEKLVEFAGRACYRSWKEGLNANVKTVRKSSKHYLANILESAHGSVLEHANFTFVFHNVSRVFTHELVRHRAGVAISQESLRYVRLTDIGFGPPSVLHGSKTEQSMLSIIERVEEVQREAVEEFGLDDEGVPFHIKKELTSAMRRIAPMGLSTSIVWTANLRAIRHCLEMRTSEGAEAEMRYVFNQVGLMMTSECDLLFSDYEVKEGTWTTTHKKV